MLGLTEYAYCADLVITHALEWPSLTVQWLPVRALRTAYSSNPDGSTVVWVLAGSGHAV